MANYLFESDYARWTLDELSCADFERFKSSNILCEDYSVVIGDFYGKIYAGQHRIPFYHCLPTLNSIIGEKNLSLWL